MPPLRHSLTRPSSNPRKAPPDGFSDLEATLLEFAQRLRDATTSSGGGGGGGGGRPAIGTRKHEAAWPVFQITHQRSRYIYELYYEKEAISKELYDWLGRNGYVDLLLVAKWKKQGYEKLCCLRCIQTKETNFNSTCICRVPKRQLKEDQSVECVSCGCRGCSSGD